MRAAHHICPPSLGINRVSFRRFLRASRAYRRVSMCFLLEYRVVVCAQMDRTRREQLHRSSSRRADSFPKTHPIAASFTHIDVLVER